MQFIRSFLDFFIFILGSLCVFMAATGGTTLYFAEAKIEVSSLDAWMFAFIIFLLLRNLVSDYHHPSPFLLIQRNVLFTIEDENRAKKITFGGILLAGLMLTLAHCFRHWNLETHAYDMLFIHQGLFQFWSFKCDLCANSTYLNEHFSFTLGLPSLIFHFLPYNELVFIFQTTILILPLIIFMKFDFKYPFYWPILMVICLSSRAFRNSMVWDFREDHLAYFFLMLGLFFLPRKGWISFLSFSLSCFCKENIGLVVFFIGIVVGITEKKRQLALSLMILGLSVSLYAFFFWLPQNTETNITSRLSALGNSPKQMLLHLFTEPQLFLLYFGKKVFSLHSLKYLFFLIGPHVFFLRRKPYWLIAAIPGIFMNLLAEPWTQRSLQFHYDLIILPFLFLENILSLSTLAPVSTLSASIKKKTLDGVTLALLFTLLCSGRWPGYYIQKHWPKTEHRQDSLFLSRISTKEITTANLKTSAQIVHLKDIRLLHVPSNQPLYHPNDVEQFLNVNEISRGNFKPFASVQTKSIILDDTESWERWILQSITEEDIEKRILSPSGRFTFLLLKEPLEHILKKRYAS